MSSHHVSQLPAASRLELWGGVECTVNRVGDDWHDQFVRNGHDQRDADLDRFAELGIDAIRYGVVWERHAARLGSPIDWSWTDRRLNRLRELGIRPIAGLVHHGSGPAETSLIADDFPVRLAEFAARLADRYPWLEDYTPVNEPLTTARFSALYGHWYPHARSDQAFVRAVLNQCRATVLALCAVRAVNPRARLIQTEDLAYIHSTPALAYQAEFENHRRWLTFDLLTGRVDSRHPLWQYLRESGAAERELHWFREHPCPPDVAGFNYYLTSERYLDERLERYPPSTHGSNGRHLYADVEAVRVCEEGILGLGQLLRQAWDRYRLPLAVTEVHLGCHRESQVRWLLDAWQTAQELRGEAIDVRAITSWSLLGSFDWNSLCVEHQGYYESGAFDVRGGTPRPTAVAHALKMLSQGQTPDHPAYSGQGWWREPTRLQFAAAGAGRTGPCAPALAATTDRRPLLILGRNGILGQALAWACRERRLSHVVLSRSDLDITDREAIERVLGAQRPWAVINGAGFGSVDEAEGDPAMCQRANVAGPATLAAACAALAIPLVTFSSDLVFSGQQNTPYVEPDQTAPLSAFGRSQAEGERRVLAASPQALVVRTSTFFGPWDEHNFLTVALRRLLSGAKVTVAEDWICSPTYVPDLAHACLDLLIDGEYGLWHLTNQGATSWADFVRHGATLVGLDCQNLHGCLGEELKLCAPRPRFSALGSQRGLLLPKLSDGLRRYREAIGATLHA